MLDENSINERIKVLDGDIAKVAEQMQSLEKQMGEKDKQVEKLEKRVDELEANRLPPLYHIRLFSNSKCSQSSSTSSCISEPLSAFGAALAKGYC